MSESAGKPKEIALSDELGDITVKANGVRVEIHRDGSVAVYTRSDVDAYTEGAVHFHHAANDSHQAITEPQAGDRMPDGTIYAGISPDTGKKMYTTPADAKLTMKWKRAMDYAAGLEAHGHKDWRVPTKAELSVLYQNRDKGALKGTFNVTGSTPARWYGSSTESNYGYGAWGQWFDGGGHSWGSKDYESSLRCVRYEPPTPV